MVHTTWVGIGRLWNWLYETWCHLLISNLL